VAVRRPGDTGDGSPPRVGFMGTSTRTGGDEGEHRLGDPRGGGLAMCGGDGTCILGLSAKANGETATVSSMGGGNSTSSPPKVMAP
jgi:hypothetical protein